MVPAKEITQGFVFPEAQGHGQAFQVTFLSPGVWQSHGECGKKEERLLRTGSCSSVPD